MIDELCIERNDTSSELQSNPMDIETVVNRLNSVQPSNILSCSD